MRGVLRALPDDKISNLFKLKSFTDDKLRYPDPEDRIFNRVISDISVVKREITLTISDTIEIVSPGESEMGTVVSLSTTEISEITRFENTIFGVRIL